MSSSPCQVEKLMSSDFPSSSTVIDSEQLWSDVSSRIEQFVKAWGRAAAPPDLAQFLPAADDPGRPLVLSELIKVDMEQRSECGLPFRSVRDYATDFPELISQGRFPADLLYEEFHLQQKRNELTIGRFANDYETQRDELLRMLGNQDAFESTSLLKSRKPTHLQPGDAISDFQLLAKLGEGAFAAVFLAQQQSMQRQVAVKVSSDHGREPQTLAKLDHPHIVRVYDQRTDEEQGLRVLYMQYLPAGTLQEILRRIAGLSRESWNGTAFLEAVDHILAEKGLEPPEDSRQREQLQDRAWWEVVCVIGAQLADALHYAHEMEVLHRDIKPANVLFSEAATPKLADFNVSSCSKVTGATPSAYFGGSLGYMSPEQLEACNPCEERSPDDLDGRSDIFSLAIVLWEMLTGHRPFHIQHATTDRSTLLAELTSRRRAGLREDELQQLPDDCPRGLQQTLKKCLSADRDARFDNAGQLADRLRLSLQPEAERLLTTSNAGPRYWVCRWPLLVLLATLMIPNGLAGWFNYVYNYHSIIEPLGANHLFRTVQLWVNGVAFPLGLLLGIFIVRQASLTVRRRTQQESLQIADDSVRDSALRMGNRLAWLGMIEWAIAGVVYPVALSTAGAPLTGVEAVHFFGSLLICGLIAATYPFFGTTAIVLAAWYPLLLQPENVPQSDLPRLHRLEGLTWRYLILAGAIPLCALVILTTWGRAENRLALIVLSAGGLGLFAVTFGLAQKIQMTIQTLINVANDRRNRH